MKAFVGEVDQSGFRRLIPADLVPGGMPGRSARAQFPRSTTLVWALLGDRDAAAIRAEVAAGRPGAACGLLLNQAVDLISLAAADGTRPRAC